MVELIEKRVYMDLSVMLKHERQNDHFIIQLNVPIKFDRNPKGSK